MNDRDVAFLRGINVGGKNIVPMKELVALFVEAGCTEVATYIQSGNVVFRARPGALKSLPAKLEGAVRARFGLTVPVVVRTGAELRRAMTENPFLAREDPAHLHVAFLAHVPTAARVAAVDEKRSPGDRFAVVGKDLFLCLPNGVGKTKLTNAYLDRALGTTSTVRNWRTVGKLVELSSGASPSTAASR